MAAKLKLVLDRSEKPVRLNIELSSTLHRELLAYAELLGRESGTGPIELRKLVPPMLIRFMATDRGFAAAKRSRG